MGTMLVPDELWIQVGSESPPPAKALHSWEKHRGQICAPPPPPSPSFSEAKLVKQSLQALQGLPAAISALQALAANFALEAADKTRHNISTLWRLSSSTSALAKLLDQLCAAGWHRRQLDRFVEFFLGLERRKSSPGLINQAFAAAVRTILQGHSAALNVRFDHSGAQSLLDLYLYTEELRVQLEALTRICCIGGDEREEAAMYTTGDGILNKFKTFPKGAELLTYLYNLLLEPDSVHLEVLRFLFARTYEPYALFVRSCIYCAELKDPHGEFILEQAARPRRGQTSEQSKKSSLKVRFGVNIPVFLVNVCSQMLRIGQQLEVLFKLPETRDFAQALSFSLPGLIYRDETNIDAQDHRNLSVAFDKKGLNNIIRQRQHRLETIAEQYRKFFGEDCPVQMKEESQASDESEPEPEPEPEPESESESEPRTSTISSDLGDDSISHSNTSSDQELANCDETSSRSRSHSQYSIFPEEYLPDADPAAEISALLTAPDVELPKNPFLFFGQGDTEYIPTLFVDTASSWDVRSTMVNEETLAKMLVPELARIGLLSLAKAAKVEINVASVLLKDDNLPLIRRAPDRVEDEAIPQPAETDSIDRVRIQDVSQAAQGGGSWVSMLKPTQHRSISRQSFRQRRTASEIPIGVAVEKSIVDEILMQYRLVSVFTVRLLQEHLHLQEHYLALRRYYFMEIGDWADNFVTALCSHNWGHSGGHQHIVEVQGMMETALQKSSCDGDVYAERLQIFASSGCEGDVFVDHNSLEAYDFIELSYNVDWPLNLILTPDAFDLYKLIFKLLLRVKHATFALGEITSALQIMERSVRKFNPLDQQQKRFRAFQLFKHQIGHFITAFQFHVHSQLLHVVWNDFVEAIKHEIKDMQDLEVVHHKYLLNAVNQCFLSPEHSGMKSCIDKIMQCLLDFRSSLKNMRSWGEGEEICSDKLYRKILKLRTSFHENICRLHKYYMKSEAQYQLAEFWTALDYNGYFASTC